MEGWEHIRINEENAVNNLRLSLVANEIHFMTERIPARACKENPGRVEIAC